MDAKDVFEELEKKILWISTRSNSIKKGYRGIDVVNC